MHGDESASQSCTTQHAPLQGTGKRPRLHKQTCHMGLRAAAPLLMRVRRSAACGRSLQCGVLLMGVTITALFLLLASRSSGALQATAAAQSLYPVGPALRTALVKSVSAPSSPGNREVRLSPRETPRPAQYNPRLPESRASKEVCCCQRWRCFQDHGLMVVLLHAPPPPPSFATPFRHGNPPPPPAHSIAADEWRTQGNIRSGTLCRLPKCFPGEMCGVL